MRSASCATMSAWLEAKRPSLTQNAAAFAAAMRHHLALSYLACGAPAVTYKCSDPDHACDP
jgi:hypothetical protein